MTSNQSVGSSNLSGGTFCSVIASVARRSHINFTIIIKHIFHPFDNLRSTPARVPMRGLCQSVACSNHAGGIFYSVIASVARRSHINFTTIIKHIFHNFNNLRSTPVRVPMRRLCQMVGSSNPHKGDFVSPGALNIAENMPHYPTFWVRKSPIKI